MMSGVISIVAYVNPFKNRQTAGAEPPADCRRAFVYLSLARPSNPPRLFMFHRHPLDFALFERAGDEVERVAHHAVTMLDACILQGFNNDVRDQPAHCIQTLL